MTSISLFFSIFPCRMAFYCCYFLTSLCSSLYLTAMPIACLSLPAFITTNAFVRIRITTLLVNPPACCGRTLVKRRGCVNLYLIVPICCVKKGEYDIIGVLPYLNLKSYSCLHVYHELWNTWPGSWHLKHNGFSETDLVKVYKAIVRPVADYMMEVYHSMLSDAQDKAIERLQTHALKCIFTPGLSGRKLRALSGLTTLHERRIEHCDKFDEMFVRNPRFEHWFPERRLSLGR